MRTLAIETASEACSIALFEGEALIAHDHRVLGRGHAENLVPMIAALPGKGCAPAIRVSLGPGSFTGVRIGLATARALGVAWGAQVIGLPTLALIAAMARARQGDAPVTVCTAGGHGEWFVQHFNAAGLPEGEALSLSPQAARIATHHPFVAGNRARDLIEVDGTEPEGAALDILPDAACALLVPAALLAPAYAPIYGRAPDATPQAPVPAA